MPVEIPLQGNKYLTYTLRGIFRYGYTIHTMGIAHTGVTIHTMGIAHTGLIFRMLSFIQNNTIGRLSGAPWYS